MSSPSELPWPAPGDVVFDGGGDWRLRANLDVRPSPWSIAEGYARAADVLLEHLRGGRHDVDLLVFPIVFAWRQHVELLMKEAIRLGRLVCGVDAEPMRSHSLLVLWRCCRPLIEARWPQVEEARADDLPAVQGLVEQVDRVDPGSYAFRFDADTRGAPALPADLREIDLQRLAASMRALGTFFEAVGTAFDAYLEAQRELEQEWRAMADEAGHDGWR